MQVLWFVLSTMAFVAVVVAAWRHGTAIVAQVRLPLGSVACVLPALFLLSEVGVYTGLKDRPNIAMFSGVRVASCAPNHLVMRGRFYSSVFHRDLLLVRTPGGQTSGIPVLSLQARSDWAKRHGERDPLVEAYRSGNITRLHAGVEEPFDLAALDGAAADSWLEGVLPHRLFWFSPLSEADLRCSMPDLFPANVEASR
jgi:hypothetical protein